MVAAASALALAAASLVAATPSAAGALSVSAAASPLSRVSGFGFLNPGESLAPRPSPPLHFFPYPRRWLLSMAYSIVAGRNSGSIKIDP